VTSKQQVIGTARQRRTIGLRSVKTLPPISLDTQPRARPAGVGMLLEPGYVLLGPGSGLATLFPTVHP